MRAGMPAIREYDRYQGVEEMMPKAFAVSANHNDFDVHQKQPHGL